MKSGEMTAGGNLVEAVLSWGGVGGTVLATKYLHAGDSFTVGEGEGCDALVPYEALGLPRAELVTCDAGGALVLPPVLAHAWLDGMPVAAEPIALAVGQVVDVVLGAFTLRTRYVAEEPYAVPFAEGIKAADYGGLALSALAHLSCFAALALFLPALGATDDEEISRDQMLTMRHLLDASAEHEQEQLDQQGPQQADEPEDHGASGGGRAIGKAGTMGKEHAPKDAGHWSAAGDTPRELQTLSHDEKVALVKDWAMLGLIATMSGDPNAPTVPWGDVLRGSDRESHMGALFGPQAADSWGIGGLSLGGTDEGGDGNNLGIGVNDIGGLSASLDRRIGAGDPGGWGHGCGGKPCGLSRGHQVGAGLRMPREITTNGRLPREVIQRIVRQNMGRFRACYEGGLRTNPSLEGRVDVQFIIDRTGQVSVAQDAADSTLPNADVRKCIVKSFFSLSFPEPNGGTVTVSYPIALTPAD